MESLGIGDAGFWLYLRTQTYAVDIAFVVIMATLLSQWWEAYGQWLNDEPKRLSGELTAASTYTAWGRLFKAIATAGLVVGFLKLLYG